MTCCGWWPKLYHLPISMTFLIFQLVPEFIPLCEWEGGYHDWFHLHMSIIRITFSDTQISHVFRENDIFLVFYFIYIKMTLLPSSKKAILWKADEALLQVMGDLWKIDIMLPCIQGNAKCCYLNMWCWGYKNYFSMFLLLQSLFLCLFSITKVLPKFSWKDLDTVNLECCNLYLRQCFPFGITYNDVPRPKCCILH